jgi:hypothetical protein
MDDNRRSSLGSENGCDPSDGAGLRGVRVENLGSPGADLPHEEEKCGEVSKPDGALQRRQVDRNHSVLLGETVHGALPRTLPASD